MTIRLRLALSLIGILVLFGVNLAIISWGSHRRSGSVDQLTVAVQRRLLLVNIAQHVAQRQKELAVLDSLATGSGAATLAPEQVEEVEQRVGSIAREVGLLESLSGGTVKSKVAAFRQTWTKLAASWHDILRRLATAQDAGAPAAATATDAAVADTLAGKALGALRELESDEQGRVEQATHNFFAVAALTNKLTMVIFAVTALVLLALALHMTTFLNRGLAQLGEGASRIGGGELDFRIERRSKDELGDLARAFNTMATNLSRAHAEVEDARAAAESANQAKSAFLASMSHELRTPMNAIIGYSEILLEDAEAEGREDVAADLKKIRAAGKHLLALINDVLDLSKIEAGKMTLFVETFDVRTLVEDVATTVAPLVEKNGNTLEVTVAAELATMRADQTKVRQALFNLLSNAAKFTRQGRIDLRAAAERRVGRDWVVFEVADTGIGLKPEQADAIFEEFSQAEASTSKEFGGTGLGLPISRKFCRLMGGDITVASAPGQGSAFRITLPAEVREPGGSAATAVQAAPGEPDRERRTVLLIDDDPTVLDLTERVLTREGFRVIRASRGEEGIELAVQARPMAITLDLVMPGMDGWTVLAALKRNPQTADIPVILMTMLDDRASGMALGACELLTKPVERDRLVALLKRLSGEGASSGSALVVDDDATTRSLLRRIVEPEGWSVREAANGRIALELMAEDTPDLILLDLMMPEMDGFEFLNEVRSSDGGQSIPVVIISAKELTEEDRLRLNGSVTQVLRKGAYDSTELFGEITDLLKRYARATA